MPNDLDDDFDDDTPDHGESPTIKQMRSEIRSLQKQLKDAADAGARAAQLERELTLTKLGANMEDPKAKYLPQTDNVDELKQAAIDLGLVEAPKPDVPPEEVAAHQRIAAASTGADPSAPDPLAGALNATSEAEFWAQAEAAGMVQGN